MTEETLFELALRTPEEERSALLDRACVGKPELRTRVEALLKADADSSPLSKPSPANEATTGFQATASFTSAEPSPGIIIAGRYTLEQKLGEGGMGEVWVAKQSEPVKRRVALKLIKAGMDSKSVVQRFEQERQALAMMDHPNIAKVLDGGLHDHRPFFVMELVKGTLITEFCDARKITPKERLELFVPVCQAIQHAHQKGIIHRDIKPSNVLVALYDDKPVPKVIDFGVAKATGGTLTEATIDTGFGGIVGTPQYMSPEQATFNNLDIDTRSDVYALGILLYELLTGTTPFTKKELAQKGLIEILRVIREEDPPRPSTKLSTADALPSLSANRGTEPKKLTGLLRNELDWIVMKALEKDRSRRYETANGFAADINRYLCGEPVLAHPPSTAYRISKFIRRNKGKVIAAGLILAALLAGIIGTTLGLLEAQKQEQAALSSADRERKAKELAGERLVQVEAEKKKVEAEKKRTDEEKRIAQTVKDFLQTKLLAQADTTAQADALIQAGGLAAEAKLNPSISELLDRAAKELAPDKIEANFPTQPLVQAELLRTVGDAYRGIGEAGTAVDFLKRSVELFRQHHGPDHSDTLTSMNSLALGYKDTRKLDLALPLLEETLKLTKAKLGLDHLDTLASMNNLAMVYNAAGKLDQALPLYEETLKLVKSKLGSDHPHTLASMNNLAAGYRAAGKLDRALPLHEKTLKLQKTKLGPDHPQTLLSMGNLAAGYSAAGKFDQALPLYEESLQLMKAKLGPDHPHTLSIMSSLAMGYRDARKLDLALPLFEETLILRKAKFGPDHADTLGSMNNLAVGYRDARMLDLALPLFEETLKLRKAKLGPDHPDTLSSMNNLASGYSAAGKLEKALPLSEETFRLTKAKLGPDHPQTLTSMGNLGKAYCDARQEQKAIPLLKEFIAGQRKRYPKDDPRFAGMLAQVALALLKCDQFAEAEPLLREYLAMREKTQPDAWSTFNTQSLLGASLLGQKKYTDAEPLLLKGYEGLKAREKTIPPQGNARLPEALDRLIQFYTDTNKPDEVKKWQAEKKKYPKTPERK